MIKTVGPAPVLLLEEWHDPPCMKGKDRKCGEFTHAIPEPHGSQHTLTGVSV